MIVEESALAALKVRRDRFYLTLSAMYDGEAEGFAASLRPGFHPLVVERLSIGGVAEAERGGISDLALFVAISVAKTDPVITDAWTVADQRDTQRMRKAAEGAALMVRARMKLREMRGRFLSLSSPPEVGHDKIQHLDVLSLPNGRICLIAFAPLLTPGLKTGSWLVASLDGKAFVLTERFALEESGDVRRRELARVEDADTQLSELVMAQPWVDLVVFRPEISAEAPFDESAMEVLTFRTKASRQDSGVIDDETTRRLDRYLPAPEVVEDLEEAGAPGHEVANG